MSLQSRARHVQQLTGMPYQTCVQTIRDLGRAPAKVCTRTGWTLKASDLFLMKSHAPNELAELGLTPEDLQP